VSKHGVPAPDGPPSSAELRRILARVPAQAPAESIEEALLRGQMRLSDVDDPTALSGPWTRSGVLDLLPEPRPGRRDGTVETNLVRKGMFVAGRAGRRRSGGEQMVLRVLATRDRLGEIRRIDEGPPLTEVEFQVMMVICTAWRSLGNQFAATVPITLSMICKELGLNYSGRSFARVRQALSALTQATFAGEVWDVRTNEMTHIREFGLIQEWEAGRPNERGRLGDVGSVMLRDWLRRQLAGEHQTYYSRELMRGLRRPVAKLLLPYLESERFDAPPGVHGTRVKTWPVNEELFASVGITDRQARQARRTLALAAQEIVEVGEGRRWIRIEVEQGDRRNWRLVAERAGG
jgi:hypothetical protein